MESENCRMQSVNKRIKNVISNPNTVLKIKNIENFADDLAPTYLLRHHHRRRRHMNLRWIHNTNPHRLSAHWDRNLDLQKQKLII